MTTRINNTRFESIPDRIDDEDCGCRQCKRRPNDWGDDWDDTENVDEGEEE